MPVPPRVSIVLPVRNARDTLADCLASIRGQSLSRFELLALDDGSTDGSLELLERVASEDARIRVLARGHVGLVGALNLGIEAAAAPLIARMDADDLMHPRRLEEQARFMDEHVGIDLVASMVELFPEGSIQAGYREYVRWQNECVHPDEIASNIYLEAPFAHPSVMIRQNVLTRLGGYRDGPFPEDYDLWLRMHAAGCRMAKLPRVLLRWRDSPDRASRNDPRYSREAFGWLRARYLAEDPRLQGERPVVVWGAGRKTRRRVRHLFDRGVRIAAWIDIDPRKIGRVTEGKAVHGPGWLAREPRPFVLVYVATHGARELIEEELGRLGYRPGEDFLQVG